MKLIVGLGNPGDEYKRTRHNAGFLAVDGIRNKESGIREWYFEKKFLAEISETKIKGGRVIFAKPQTFMNKSGEAVGKLARFYKVKSADVWVIHDDLDLPLGTLRIKLGGGSAGHKGVESVARAIGKEFVRFRIGVNSARARATADELVLKKFSASGQKKLQPALERVHEAIVVAIQEGLPKAMSLFNA